VALVSTKGSFSLFTFSLFCFPLSYFPVGSSSFALLLMLMKFLHQQVLGDVFEALLAVVFVDSGLRLEPVFAVLDKLFAEIMPFLSELSFRDPYSRFVMLRQTLLCKEMSIKFVLFSLTFLPPLSCPSTESPASTLPPLTPSCLNLPSLRPSPPSQPSTLFP
jgi:hypothetical protein